MTTTQRKLRVLALLTMTLCLVCLSTFHSSHGYRYPKYGFRDPKRLKQPFHESTTTTPPTTSVIHNTETTSSVLWNPSPALNNDNTPQNKKKPRIQIHNLR